jgi:hypothetical protein
MRLRYVQTVHFGKSELTNWLEILLKKPEFGSAKSKAHLRKDDVVLLVSKTGDQLVFLHGFDLFEEQKILRSTRLRIAGGDKWNPLMLVNYAKSVGLKIDGLKTYEEHVAGIIQTMETAFTNVLSSQKKKLKGNK